MRVSHTQLKLYQTSPRAWFNKYVLGLREEIMSSALFFGSIVEAGCNESLNGKSLEESIAKFEKEFQRYKINGKWENLKTSNKIKWFKSDFQEFAHSDDELEKLIELPHNIKSWTSRLASGKLMVTEFHEKILPEIKEVISMQEYLSIDTGEDQIIGYADVICVLKDGRRIVLDIKTSANPYKLNSVLTGDKGTQTALYFAALKEKHDLDAAGFGVLEKKIRKRTPKTRSQLIVDTPPQSLIQETLDEFDNMIYNVRQAKFPCKAPDCNQFGQKCCFSGFCKTGGTDTAGLIWSKK